LALKIQRTLNGKGSKGLYKELLWQSVSLRGSPSLTANGEIGILLTDLCPSDQARAVCGC